MSTIFVFVWLLAAQCAWAVPDTAQYYNQGVLSSSSNYDDWSPGGGCSYIQNIPSVFPASSIWSSTGIAIQNYHKGQVCGMCVKITNVTDASPDVPNTFPSPPFIAIITNTGDDALSDYWLDFYQKPATGGNWWLNWQAVECPVGEQGIQWQVQSDSGYYFKVVPIYARIVVHTMCVLATKVGEVNSTWVQMDRYDNGNFYFTAGGTYQPLGAPKVKAISADGQVIEDTIDINLANSGRYVDWAIHPGTNPSNFRPLSGAITSNPPDCNGKVTNDDHYNGGDLSSASLLHHPALVLW